MRYATLGRRIWVSKSYSMLRIYEVCFKMFKLFVKICQKHYFTLCVFLGNAFSRSTFCFSTTASARIIDEPPKILGAIFHVNPFSTFHLRNSWIDYFRSTRKFFYLVIYIYFQFLSHELSQYFCLFLSIWYHTFLFIHSCLATKTQVTLRPWMN